MSHEELLKEADRHVLAGCRDRCFLHVSPCVDLRALASALRAEVEAHAETTTLHVQTRAALDEAVRHLATAQAALEATNRQIVIMRTALETARDTASACVLAWEDGQESTATFVRDVERILNVATASLAASAPPPPKPT